MREVAPGHSRPSIRIPQEWLQQHLTAKRAETVLITVVSQPPVSHRPLHGGAVPTRPPRLGGAGSTDNGIARAVLPRTVDRAGTRYDHHVTGRRTRRPALAREQLDPAIAAQDLRPFQRGRLDNPVLRDRPAAIDLFDRPVFPQPIVADPNARAAVQEEVALAVLADRVAWIDIA